MTSDVPSDVLPDRTSKSKVDAILMFCAIAQAFDASPMEADGCIIFHFRVGGYQLEVQFDPWAMDISITSPLENPNFLNRYSVAEGKGKLKALLTYKKLLEMRKGEGADDGWKVILQKDWS